MTKPASDALARNLDLGGLGFTFVEIETVVLTFYSRVAVDSVLKVPFSSVNDWPHHIERLTHFWWMRLGGERYMDVTYNPPLKHLEAGFNRAFLTRWLDLFREVLLEKLPTEKAAAWNKTATMMGEALSMKNDALKAKLGR